MTSKDLVSETLQQIIDLLANTQIIRKKYGCEYAAETPALLSSQVINLLLSPAHSMS